MIKLTLEFLPYGEESNQETLGTIEIYNDRTGTDELGNYKVFFISSFPGEDETPIELDRVLGHKRSQKHGAWVLCREALKVVLAWMRKK